MEDMSIQTKPLLIYEGQCYFCRRWINRWRHVTGDRVDYAPYEEVSHRFPEIPPERFEASVLLVEPDGTLYDGAEAVFRALAHVPGKSWPLGLYQNVPGFAPASEWVYRCVARYRSGLGRLSRWVFGTETQPPSYVLVRRLFLILLGIIYFIAFVSLWVQLDGLVGSRGILPVADFLQGVRENLGTERYWLLPTLFWLNDGDGFLNLLCLAGAGLSLCVVAGLAPALALGVLWMIYLSFLNVCGDFLAFQWDTMLLETGFLAIFLVPFQLRPRLSEEPAPSPVVTWLLRWLLFRIMFSSGMVKLLSGDPSWHNLTALDFHFETQPLPTWIGWYVHQLPGEVHRLGVAGVFFTQLVVPFMIFGPRGARYAACAIFVVFQVLIFLTGNYCFFNLITITLCLVLLDDGVLRKMLPKRVLSLVGKTGARRGEPGAKRWAVGGVAALILLVSGMQMIPMVVGSVPWPQPALAVYQSVRPFHTVNPYGLFAVMTTRRPEIIVEGSDDGVTWKAYEFKWKPGDVKRAPGFVAPHQPRLDWQMWFAALGNYQRNAWFVSFLGRLLEGSGEVLTLLAHNPFPEKPPRFIRAQVYDYHFTSLETKRANGAWWRREFKGPYLPVLQRRQNR